MRCVICKQGETRPGTATVTLQREESTIIIKDVPAEICENCGEYYLSESITEKVMTRAEESIKKGAEVEILRFAA
ncbi:MAG: type II toxin-antitoxin system MqsA family antitoxin [Candidatus Abyssobacteria bacterium SURF_5]|uniref:Type II toxin-antitoxin system MqsA family antitoxin n=1 Tax=Abyssobacteria bacterium (strain SURF_5) TaxID=2093360 RepID=A0A3A4P6R8_ABYX5|nr:MAG: type II toxin-antitoxin system MqsA family antitoxin [Candidatus Abyssubacteria bacterium SURF_5]